MRILERYLLKELVVNGAVTFLIMSALIMMLVFSVTTLKTGFATLDVRSLLEIVFYLSAVRLDVIIPLSVLSAALWTYARAAGDREVTAMRGAGIHLYDIVMPALVLGAGATLLLAWLQDEAMPAAHYSKKLAGKRFLAESVGNLLAGPQQQIEDSRFRCTWARSGLDEDGKRVLYDVVVSETPRGGGLPVVTRAERARPTYDRRRSRLRLDLRGLRHGENMASEALTVELDLNAISEESLPSKAWESRSYEELMTRAARDRDNPEGLKAEVELQRRIANAFSALLFAFLGAPLGVAMRFSSRATIYVVGFLLVLVLGFAPTIVGIELARGGVLPPVAALWAGNLLVAVAGTLAFLRALRR